MEGGRGVSMDLLMQSFVGEEGSWKKFIHQSVAGHYQIHFYIFFFGNIIVCYARYKI